MGHHRHARDREAAPFSIWSLWAAIMVAGLGIVAYAVGNAIHKANERDTEVAEHLANPMGAIR